MPLLPESLLMLPADREHKHREIAGYLRSLVLARVVRGFSAVFSPSLLVVEF